MTIESTWEVRKVRSTAWDRWCAALLAALRCAAASPGLTLEELDLPIPQSGCCFTFGAAKGPLPAGALLELWARDPASHGPCPKCGGQGVANAFGGLINVGGYLGLCLHCASPIFRSIGGLGAVRQHVTPFLEGTPWTIQGSIFGGAHASDGRELARALGHAEAPKATRSDRPKVSVGRHRLVVPDVDIVG
jgi:hypothetical protein